MALRRLLPLVLGLSLGLACTGDGRSPQPPAATSPLPLPPGLAEGEASIRQELESRHRAALDGLAEATLSPVGLAKLFGELGISLYAHGFNEEAAAAFRQAAETAPDAFDWNYLEGHATRRTGDMEGAAAAFGRALESDEHSLPARLWLAEVHLHREQMAAAQRGFERGLEQAPHCAQAWAGLGRIALANGDYSHARELLQTALEHRPDLPQARYALAMALRGAGRLGEARRQLERLDGENHSLIVTCFEDPLIQQMKRRQTGSRAHEQRASKARREGRFSAALTELGAAVAANPNRFPARYDIAFMLFRLDRLHKARAELDALLAIRPHYPAALALMSRIALAEDDPQTAEALIDRALAADSQSEDVHLARGDYLQAVGRNGEAAIAYQQATAIAPGLVPAIAGRTACLFALGRSTEALTELERQATAFPTRTPVALLRAFALLAANDPQDRPTAIALAQRAAARQPTVGAALTLALALASDRRFTEASEWQQLALDAMPPSPALAGQRRRAEQQLTALRAARTLQLYTDNESLSAVLLTLPLPAATAASSKPKESR